MEQKDKRVLHVALGDDVKKVSITGLDGDEKVVMRQELDEDELDLATGGGGSKTMPIMPRFDRIPHDKP